MADIVNLRQQRKTKARAEKAKRATDNRIRFGRTKAEKRRSRAVEALEARRHDAGKLDDA